MNKRVLIFSSEVKDREDITGVLEEYFKKNFGRYLDKIEIQKYPKLDIPFEGDKLGHWGEGEILVVIDRHISPRKNRTRSFKDTLSYKFLEESYKVSVNLCEKKDIPYLIYRGQVAQKKEEEFKWEIEMLRERIQGRLEAKL